MPILKSIICQPALLVYFECYSHILTQGRKIKKSWEWESDSILSWGLFLLGSHLHISVSNYMETYGTCNYNAT